MSYSLKAGKVVFVNLEMFESYVFLKGEFKVVRLIVGG